MLGAEFIDTISSWDIQHQVGVEDFADRWNFLFTTGVLIMCTVIVAARQYIVGEPITCFIPSQVSGSTFEDYMENICWVQGTYPLPVDSQFSNTEEFWKSLASKKLMYYQWVPFILGLQTMLFYLPRIVWLALASRRSGADSAGGARREAGTSDGEDREKIVHQTAVDLEQLLLLAKRSELSRGALSKLLGAGKRLSSGLTTGYLFTFLRLGASNHSSVLYGAEILSNIAAGRDWRSTMVFPRVTFCRTEFAIFGEQWELGIGELVWGWGQGGTQRYIAQCALPVNMLNEKIYIFLWFWMAIGLLITALSVPAWLLRVASCRGRSRYVRRHLQLRQEGLADKRLVGEFVDRFLRHDGVFLLKMMQMNVGDLVTGDVTLHLYRLWLRKHRERGWEASTRSCHWRLDPRFDVAEFIFATLIDQHWSLS
uniref:Innexin n=1 Tax=Macrostomum lignano TaxID=282301 RepID=A0A1I8IDP9_9PLAT